MEASAALERLREISSQVREAVVFDRQGAVVASTLDDEERAGEIVHEARELLGAAERWGGGSGAPFAQLEAAVQSGSVFVVGHDERLIAATTPADPTVGLVFYDLKSCLRELAEPAPEKPKRAPATRSPAKPRPKAAEAEPELEPEPDAKSTDAKP
jgi:predicted regulator of Ras-like GTPase activity (Roadblock/LC7/MglB family)